MCEPCKNNDHENCTGPGCDCPKRQQDEAVERQVAAITSRDAALAESILSTLQYSGSSIAKLFIENAGRDQTRAFVHEIIRTAAALRC